MKSEIYLGKEFTDELGHGYKYISKSPSPTRPGKWIYKYSEIKGDQYHKNQTQHDYYTRDTDEWLSRNTSHTLGNDKGDSRYNQSRTRHYHERGKLERGVNKVGSYVSTGAKTVKSYTSITVSSIKSTGSKAISSGKSFIDKFFRR